MLIKTGGVIPYSEITPEAVGLNRRRFLKRAGLGAVGGSLIPRWANASHLRHATDDELTPYETVIGYNNFYEFGTGKADPAKNAKNFQTRPWTVVVKGEIKVEKTWDLEDLIGDLTVEERVYRHRCVEGWSMVVPWNGFPLRDLIAKLEPTSRAKYVEFTTLKDSKRMPGQKSSVLDWPYVEALRLDEAMHPLTMMATGLYGKTLLPQNGAPWRLVVPWKYGFKGGKSIVRIRFTKKQPKTTWNVAIPPEYGFYANVNPEVNHPRWSQATERRLGDFFKRDTLMFNGYADEVQSLYSGMDLRKYY